MWPAVTSRPLLVSSVPSCSRRDRTVKLRQLSHPEYEEAAGGATRDLNGRLAEEPSTCQRRKEQQGPVSAPRRTSSTSVPPAPVSNMCMRTPPWRPSLGGGFLKPLILAKKSTAPSRASACKTKSKLVPLWGHGGGLAAAGDAILKHWGGAEAPENQV